jgi:transcriptional regulator with GAF, ATPase, and Fis domain
MAAIPGLIGESVPMRAVGALVRAAAASTVPVLIEGETGTGKELVARAVAALGPRRRAPFVALNCAALPESMLDTELFGHRRGAFTGADGDRRGLLESADGGTLFLDEICSTGPAFQARLLRVLENAEVRAVGCDRAREVDLRVVAASNQPLEQCVARGRFRADLFYRLSVFPVAMPPLRQRREDVPLLVAYFLGHLRAGGRVTIRDVAPEALARLAAYDFPGNVRELKNEVTRAATLAAGGEWIEVGHLSERIRAATAALSPPSTAPACLHERRAAALADLERRMVCEALERHEYNLTRAARALQISRFGLRKRMRRLGVSVRRSLASAPGRSPDLVRSA